MKICNTHFFEFQRGKSLTLVQFWAYTAAEELGLLSEEIRLLASRRGNQDQSNNSTTSPAAQPTPKPYRPPLLITREKVMATVFGAGYPSLPTMTLDEYYEMQVRVFLINLR